MKDQCGCIVDRKYASDFLVRRLFYVNKVPKGFVKIGEKVIDGRKIELFYNKDDNFPLRYRSTECPISIITLEVLCEEFYNSRKLTKESALSAVKKVKGLTINDLSKNIAEEVVKILEESSIYS